MKKILLIVIGLFILQLQAQQTLFEDNAFNYTTWINGSNAGTGFTVWDI